MRSDPDSRPSPPAIVLRALLYALVATLLVLYAPSEPHVFIYAGF